jgi:PleD family two-component response regulator
MMARVLIVQGHARSRADTAAALRAEGHDVLEAEAFLLLLPGTKLDAAWYVAERVRRRTAVIGAALGPDGPTLTASFGVAEHRPPTPGATSSTAPKPPYPSQTSRPQPLRVA